MEQKLEDIIRQIAQQCIREYIKQTPEDKSSVIYADISELLTDYYKDGEKDAAMTYAIHARRFDPYYRIIPMYYRDNQTLEVIAATLEVDISTVVRNKKRLCIEIYRDII